MKNKQDQQPLNGAWLAIGAGVGTALGVAMDNIAIGVALGVAIGLAVGTYMQNKQDQDKE